MPSVRATMPDWNRPIGIPISVVMVEQRAYLFHAILFPVVSGSAFCSRQIGVFSVRWCSYWDTESGFYWVMDMVFGENRRLLTESAMQPRI